MTSVLLDTHVWAWSMNEPERLSPAATAAIERAEARYVSPISFYEIGQKVRLGHWPEMEPVIGKLAEVLREQGGVAAPFTPEICLYASLVDWDHRDPFDRLLAATADLHGLTIISRDPVFTRLPSVRCVW